MFFISGVKGLNQNLSTILLSLNQIIMKLKSFVSELTPFDCVLCVGNREMEVAPSCSSLIC